MSLNTCTLSGYLGSDSELISTSSGYSILSFSLCVDMWKKGKDGKGELVPNWFDCVMFGKHGESLARYLTKGAKVSLVGSLRQDKWMKENVTYSRIKVVVDSIELLNGNKRYHAAAMDQAQSDSSYDDDPASLYDEDIPF